MKLAIQSRIPYLYMICDPREQPLLTAGAYVFQVVEVAESDPI
jgi:hypothetical protein